MWVDDTGGFVVRLPGGTCVGYEVMDPATGFLVESRCQRCWVATGSGTSGRGSREASSRWANKGRNPQEADSITNCENRVTFSERSYAHCSVCRYVDPQTCHVILGIS